MGNHRGYILLTLVFLQCLCFAASNGTGFEPAFVPEPRGRGTVGILWSGLITLGLCVWTSIHPDVLPNPTTWRLIRHRLMWMVVALLAPEIVLLYAFDQRRRAVGIHKAWCKQFDIISGSPEDNMGMEGAFFVVMGGCVVDENPEINDVNSEKDNLTSSYLTLTSEGFLHYLAANKISRRCISKRVIIDKGKADIIAKFLVCLQALWMVIECSARKASNLPITLLELHVVIQLMFAVASYILWGYKPLNAQEPIVLSIDGMENPPPDIDEFTIAKGKHHFYSLSDVSTSLQIASICVTIFASAAHLTAWNYSFPTYVEGILWKISSISLATPFFWMIIALAAGFVQEFIPRSVYNFFTYYLGDPLVGAISLVTLSLYSFGIVFITVESFISLRKVPLGTYESAQWMDFWPHI